MDIPPAAVRRGTKKEEETVMKRVFSMFMTVALLVAGVAMTGCKNDNNEPQALKTTYHMSINATKGTDNQADGPRRVLTPNGSSIDATWAAGEEVNVYYYIDYYQVGEEWFGGEWTNIGTLTAETSGASTTLTGDLTVENLEVGKELRLVYNGSPINYDNQLGTLEYISNNCDGAFATVTVNGISGNTISTTDAEFESLQAIVKFTLLDAANDQPINASQLKISVVIMTEYGAYNGIYVLKRPQESYKFSDKSITINLASAASEIWAAMSCVTSPSGGQSDITMIATVGSDTYLYTKSNVTFVDGKFYTINVKMTKYIPVPGQLSGKFSVSPTKKVYFSKGNLQYNAGDYQFATNQWDYLGTTSGTTYDLFPWYSSSSDLGKNAITNGGNAANAGWYTLTKDEWDYLRSHGQSAPCELNGVNGYILAPDDYDGYLAGATYSFDEWTLSASDWTYYESNGCVFLPQGTGYWSVTEYDWDDTKAYKLQIVQDEWGISREMTTDDKTNCNSVRLVIDVPF